MYQKFRLHSKPCAAWKKNRAGPFKPAQIKNEKQAYQELARNTVHRIMSDQLRSLVWSKDWLRQESCLIPAPSGSGVNHV